MNAVFRLKSGFKRAAGLFRPRNVSPLVREIESLPVAEIDRNPDRPKIRLRNGPVFVGLPPDEHASDLWRQLRRGSQRALAVECIGLLKDIICRYRYPHADATACPPYPIAQRRLFHPQQRDTVEDVTGIDAAARLSLRQRFTIRSDDTVIDAGAFLGLGALRLSELIGPGGKVVSFEPNPVNQQIFLENVANNGCSNIHLIKAACWKESGFLKLQCETHQRNSLVDGVVDPEGGSVEVPTRSIDDVVDEMALDGVDVISLTINGAELEGLEGGLKTVERFRPRLTIAGWYHRDGKRVDELISPVLRRIGYDFLIGPVGRIYAWKD